MSRSKPLSKRNRPVILLTPQEIAEDQALRERLLARLEAYIDNLVRQGHVRCPGCGRMEPPPDRNQDIG